MNQNASHADIITMLRDGHSNSRIRRELHADVARVRRIRAELGLAAFVPAEQTRTVEEKWRLFARPTDGGHMEWTGERVGPAGSPTMRYKDGSYSPAAIAFELRHGRPPKGYAIADCGRERCIAPDHVDDEAGRLTRRQAIRRAKGRGDRPDTCSSGHDQGIYGRLQGDGRPYCEACKRARKSEPADQREARLAAREEARQARRKARETVQEAQRQACAAARETVRQNIEALLREGVPQLSIARRLHVAPITVQRTREALALPAPRRGPRVRYGSLADAFRANTAPAGGGHLRWTGARKGNPQVSLRRKRFTAARVSFELHHGRPPVGQVMPDCEMAGCLAGGHLSDRPMREANQRADKAYTAIFGQTA